jgi:peptidyl-prolyl cis-trans isomerase C
VIATVVIATTAGCRKGPELTAAAQTPAGQATPVTPGQATANDPALSKPAPPKPMPAVLPDVLARVNGQPVTKADFDRFMKNMEAQQGPVPADRRDEVFRAVLDKLITYNVLKQEAAARGVVVPEAEIDGQVQQIQQQFPDPAEFKKALDARNTSIEQLKSDAKVQLSISKMMDADVSTVAAATEPEAKDFYDKNPDKFKQGEAVRASHILVMANEQADDATKKAARAKVDGILERVKSGEDFAKLARENSDDGSKEQGGDLGFFQQGRMVPEFDKAAFSLKPGEVSDVVTTQFGYHIIKVSERKNASTVPFDTVKGKIVEYLSGQKKQEKANATIEDAKKKAKIEVLV